MTPLPIFEVTVAGEPVPKGRPRVGRGRAYTPARTTAAENAVAWEARVAMGSRKPYTGTVDVHLSFRCSTRRRVDVDNLAKLVLDALQGIVFENDSQVADLHVAKHVGDDPSTVIRVYTDPAHAEAA